LIEIKWKKEWFKNLPYNTYGYWKDMKNQRSFFDNLGKKLNVKTPSDWANFPFRVIIENQGGYLSFLYRGSMYSALKSVYPSRKIDSSLI
jgi:hypothetical protein